MKKEPLAPANTIPEELRILTNLSFVVADITDTLLLDTSTALNRLDLDLRHETKRRWNDMRQAIKTARIRTKIFTEEMYAITEAEDACDDSDYLKDLLLLICDRVGNDDDTQVKLRAMIFNMPTKLGFYEKLAEITNARQ